uniref:Uncharacterized protein n=1 Tax=Electrophorus electricus TaxID=8005 RepID=A0A4W4EMT9_ELEEL
MTAGTVWNQTFSLLSSFSLLWMDQYYCCKRNDSEVGTRGPEGAPAMDGAAVTPLVLPYEPTPSHSYCPNCTPYYTSNVRNGGKQLAFMPGLYENTGTTGHTEGPHLYSNVQSVVTDISKCI